jgi:pilus assembly protein CpaF
MTGFELILPFLRPIEALILDPSVSEVMVNGSERVFMERNGYLEPVAVTGLTEKFLLIAVKNIARRLGDDISESKPILDSRLPDGSRVAAVIPPCSVNGITLTIRKFTARNLRLVQIADEIVSVLGSDPNASVKLVVEISAEFPDGAKDEVKRAVSENARSLGLKSAEWE